MKEYFENLLGVLLAILIVFEFKVEENVRAAMNTTIGMIFCIMLLIYLFVCLNPLVAILFLIYFYENVKFDDIHSNIYNMKTKPNVMNSLQSSLLNVSNKKDVVEIETIQKMAPIIKKREKMSLSFQPNDYKLESWSTL